MAYGNVWADCKRKVVCNAFSFFFFCPCTFGTIIDLRLVHLTLTACFTDLDDVSVL